MRHRSGAGRTPIRAPTVREGLRHTRLPHGGGNPSPHGRGSDGRIPYARILSIDRHLGKSLTFMSHLTGQSSDHEKPSCELPGALAPVRLTTNCWKAKTFSFSFDFFQKQVTLDRDPSALSNKNEERLAGQVAHPLAGAGIQPCQAPC